MLEDMIVCKYYYKGRGRRGGKGVERWGEEGKKGKGKGIKLGYR